MNHRNPDSSPTPHDSSGPCPRCGRVSQFQVDTFGTRLRSYRREKANVYERADILTCFGCGESIIVVTERFGDRENRLLHVYPAPGAGSLDTAVDESVASAYDEGMRCLSIGANRAAAVMLRSALSLFVKDKGSEEAKAERHLKVALKRMKADNTLHPSLWDWADHLNQLGNEGAHPEDYDDVTAAEAQGLAKFVRNLIHIEYEMPAQLRRDQGLFTDDLEEDEATETGSMVL